MPKLAGRQLCRGVITLQGQGVIGAAWLTAAGHRRWSGSPCGPESAVAEAHIEQIFVFIFFIVSGYLAVPDSTIVNAIWPNSSLFMAATYLPTTGLLSQP